MEPQYLHLHPEQLRRLALAVSAFLLLSAPGLDVLVLLTGQSWAAPPPRSIPAWLATGILPPLQRRLLGRLARARPGAVVRVRLTLPELLALYFNLAWPADPADDLSRVLAEVHRCLTNLAHHVAGGHRLFAGYAVDVVPVGYEP